MAQTENVLLLRQTTQQPVLHVEARVKSKKKGDNNLIVRTDILREEVTQWLIDNFVFLNLGQEITCFDGLKGHHARSLESVRVTECIGCEDDASGAYRLQNVELDVQAYQLKAGMEHDGSPQPQTLGDQADSGDELLKAKVTQLPSTELDGLWESLQFDQPIQSTLLCAISRIVSFSTKNLNKWAIGWNKLILLWGAPGTGKTSFCRGLAQKLAIRLGKHFPRSKLIEINAQSLGSKFFGESGKLVSRMFESIESLSEEEEDTLVCVFVDEVETLAGRREKMLNGNEPFDAVRAVNALLTGLDRLKHRPNVFVLCTSNLITALDEAFLDRVDIKQFMPHLSHRVIYCIYKNCLEELSRCGLIEGSSFNIIQINPDDPQTPLRYVEQPAEALLLPGFEDMILNYKIIPNAIPKQLGELAQASVGLSGRTLRRLPALSLVHHARTSPCTVREALKALEMTLEREMQLKQAQTPRL